MSKAGRQTPQLISYQLISSPPIDRIPHGKDIVISFVHIKRGANLAADILYEWVEFQNLLIVQNDITDKKNDLFSFFFLPFL